MNKKKKNIKGVIALIIGVVLLVGTGIVIILKFKNKDESNQDSIQPKSNNNTSSISFNDTVSEVEKVKRMQRLLLNLGVKHNNNFIIDAINLTGGIDGKIGDGFNAALNEAIERGYVKSFYDLQNLS